MTKADLIAALAEFSDDTEVLVSADDHDSDLVVIDDIIGTEIDEETGRITKGFVKGDSVHRVERVAMIRCDWSEP